MKPLTDDTYRHRDLNWLSFNERVLQEAEDVENNPLYERLKFLAIYATNLDEFFRVRVSQLRQLKRVKKRIRKQLSLKPNAIVKEIKATVEAQHKRFGKIFREQIIPELETNNIYLLDAKSYHGQFETLINGWYQAKIKEHLEVKLVNPTEDKKVFLEDQCIYFFVTFKDSQQLGFVNIPSNKIDRFVNLATIKQKHYITFIDDIIHYKIPELFPNAIIENIYEIKMSRDAELYLDDEVDGILADRIYESLKRRHKGQPTRLLYDASMSKEDTKRLRKFLKVGKVDMMPGGRYHNFNDFFSFPDPTNNKALHYTPMPLVKHTALEESTDLFETLRQGNHLVHFPFMSFNYVEQLVEQAASDPKVEEIKISLYRVASQSPLTTALLKALGNGKKVFIFIEAKARFDEENNIRWGRTFEDKGATVIYSYPRIKVHSKILLIKRKEDGRNRRYIYIGTGNFNAKTSKIYADHGFFSADKKLGKELNRVFKVLEGDLIVPRNKHLLVSPFTTRRTFEKLIYSEIEAAREGKPAAIKIKMNSLEDKDMIALLYKASQAGVEIRMIVRGFSSLIPGVKGLSENIYMTSILDRYLEHGRMYWFYHGGDERMYIGSADWMTRNLDRRIEVLVPITDENCKKELKDILEIQLADNIKARIQNKEENNAFAKAAIDSPKVRSQYAIFEYLKEKHN
ncbi:polyphosphate kinase 1 [Dokdonia sp. Hel_I_53]|uniref:polyphosphate kinase 1 n=1 Tax=Dokdonia sp. Hel_I_53 TaxID=1566287 RepID=UPI00119B140C|nr:polyphosphate kinase 1 [Dokdonia sp. Hel_I_53]TVZ51706.1 polyphosphate kinase [Dokdonia sp. Hel_I_53]